MPNDSDPQALVSSHVFIDTQCFYRAQWRFDLGALHALRELAADRRVSVLTTSVVRREILEDLNERATLASRALREYRKQAAVFAPLDDPQIAPFFTRPDRNHLERLSENLVNQYFEACRASDVPLDSVLAEEVLDRYFQQQPPFGPGKKKNEFPDAYSLLALERFAARANRAIYVISGDPDLAAYCGMSQWLHYLPGIGEFLDLFNRNEALSERMHDLVSEEDEVISEAIALAFADLGFTTWEDAEIDDVQVNAVTIDNVSILDISAASLSLELVVEVDFTVGVTEPNYDTAIWDSEDKRFFIFEYSNRSHTQVTSFDVLATLLLDEDTDPPELIEVDAIAFDGVKRDLEISISDEEDFR